MQRIRGAAFLPAALCLLAAAARADLNDGKPCFSYLNPPGSGVRYVCTSTSSHTIEHPDTEHVTANAWRTRITARRVGEDPLYDRTFDSLSAPPDDPAVTSALADAERFVAGTTYVVDPPAVLSSSTSPVSSLPFSLVSVRTVQVTTIVLSSTPVSRTVCVGSLGDRFPSPPPLPDAPCAPGATAVILRPLDTSAGTPLEDRLEDTHTSTVTDQYTRLTVTGDLTTTHYEVVARAGPACTTTYLPHTIFGPYFSFLCRTTSHHANRIASTASVPSDAWSTRVTSRSGEGPVLFDVTINSTADPVIDDEVRRTLANARQAVVQAGSAGAAVDGPILLSSSSDRVTGFPLPNAAQLVPVSHNFPLPTSTLLCAGDFGELPAPLGSLPAPPCRAGLTTILTPPEMAFTLFYVSDTHTHTQRDVYAGLFVTGVLTTTHYEYVGEPSTKTLTIPIVLSPTGGSAFTSELTLANLASADAQASFTYTPAFGGTAGTVTDTLPGATQRVIPDAVAYLRSLGLTDPGAGGTLRMTFDGSAAPDLYASVRTTAAVPEGRVGLAYPALPPSKLFSSSVLLSGLRQNALDRSNVAVLNAGGPADGDVTLRVTVTSGDPANPQSKALPDVTLSPGGFSQISSVLSSNGLSLGNGTARVDRVAGTAPFYAYAVVNDQATADGSFIEPLPATPSSPISSATLPVVVETAAYSTELVLTNTSPTSRTLSFTWVAPALSGGRATFSIALLPGEQQILPGFVQLLRDRGVVTNPPGPSFAGALFVSDSTGDLRGVSVSARILSALGGGRAGVALPSVPSGSESNAPVWLCGLQQNGETRSNLALVNVGSVDASPSDFRIDLYDGANGAKVASPVATVPALGFAQIDRILAAYAPGVAQGCALVTRTSGNNPFLAYAVLNDGAQPGQRSGDGAYVASRPVQ